MSEQATDLEMFQLVLLNQKKEGVASGDWHEMVFETRPNDTSINVVLKSDSVGFSFDTEGQFVGVFNYQ